MISVCMPIYNGAHHLRPAIESVLRQSHIDFELIIVDDYSTDDSVEIALEYCNNDKRIRLFRNSINLGLTGNWNRCIELAQGDWIKFVFQDDLIAPSCLEEMLAAATDKTHMLYCLRDFSFEAGVSDKTKQWYLANQTLILQSFGDATNISARDFCEATLDRIGANLVGEPTAVLLRRSVFDRFGLFNTNLIMSCDLEYWTRVATNTGLVKVPSTLATFRVHGAATSAINREKHTYRMNILDNLLVMHEFAFNPMYDNLRHAATDRRPPRDLARMFYRKAIHARRNAEAAASDPQHPNPLLLSDWNRITVTFPRLSRIPLRYRVNEKWHQLRHYLRKRTQSL